MNRAVRRLLLWAWLTGLWVLLWRDVSVANILGGVIVALVVTLAYPLAPPRDAQHRLHPGRLISFFGWFLWQLVTSNLVVARAVLSPRKKITTGVLAVPLPECSDLVTTVIANSVTLTPGTLTVEVKRDPRTIYVHVLHLEDIEDVRQGVHAMARRVLRAVTTEHVQAAFEAAITERAGTAGPGSGSESPGAPDGSSEEQG